jgi:DNA-binding MarR family transcriptional regulator
VSIDHSEQVLADWQVVRPDLDVSPTAIFNRVVRLATYLEGKFGTAVSGHALSHKGDYDTLAALRRAEPNFELSPTRLAESALITTGGMTSRIDRLERAGYVERRTDPSDRRALLVRLTELGHEVVDRALEANLEWQQELLAELSAEDQARLAHILRDLLVRLGDSRP